MTIAGEALLGRHERRYLRRLSALFVLFPRHERRRLLELARQNLEDRPPAESWVELTLQLGTPEEYARQLIHDERALPQPALWRRAAARFPSPWLAALSLVVVIAVAAGALAYRDWYTHRPDVTASVCMRPDSSEIEIVETTALAHTEWSVPFVEGAEVSFGVCVYSPETIELTAVDIPFTFDGSMLEPVSVETQSVQDPELPRPFAPFVQRGWEDPESAIDHPPRAVIFTARFADCDPSTDQGGRRQVSHVDVSYRFRDRAHDVTLPLDGTIVYFGDLFTPPCPDRPSELGAADGEDGQ